MKIIRITTEEELRTAKQIRIRVFVEEQQVPPELEMDEYDETPGSANHMLILDGMIPAATGRFVEYDRDTAKLQRIAVMQPYRGKGVGRELVLALEAWAAEKGYKASLLDAQCQAEGFYGKLGYKKVSDEIFLDAGIEHVRMKKTLYSKV